MEFLAENSPAGEALLHLVARGNSIIAELLRLADHVPPHFYLNRKEDVEKYGLILFDLSYMQKTALYEDRIMKAGPEMMELDDDFRENNMAILERYFLLFQSIFKYYLDFMRYLEDLNSGVYIQQTVESILTDTDGKQVMAEALYLFGVMLLLLDLRIPGVVRERLVVSFFRYKKRDVPEYIDEVAKLVSSTGMVNGVKPKGYPEDYFARFPVPEPVVSMIIGRLRTDDIYSQIANYPHPDHRSAALSTQAGMMYVILYFQPEILYKKEAVMREIVDKHFPDNWVFPFYMGYNVDISTRWESYKAAAGAIANTISPGNVREVLGKNLAKVPELLRVLQELLTEGTLTEEYTMRYITRILNVLRECNVTIRWLMLHSTTQHKKLKEALAPAIKPEMVLRLLLQTAQFEFVVKGTFEKLLKGKQARWDQCKKEATSRLKELGEYFSGAKELTRGTKNVDLEKWFHDTGAQINSLDFADATLAGRKIQQLIKALEEVQQFHQIETSLQVKEFLSDTNKYLMQMLLYVNVQESVMVTLSAVSDISYGFFILNDYIMEMKDQVRRDPRTVIKLRATFSKLSSILDLPLIRILQADSRDLISVSEFYSGEMVKFVRRVLDVVPEEMFLLLRKIIDLQTIGPELPIGKNQDPNTHQKGVLQELPAKIEKEKLKEFAQLPQRRMLAWLTHRVSVFTEGILAMETTLVGVVQVDPRRLLEDGIRKALVNRISHAMDERLVFTPGKNELVLRLKDVGAVLEGYRRSFEYIQDYVSIYGLKIWQEEFSRIVNFNVEQECNKFMKRFVYYWESAYFNEDIEIPIFPPKDKVSMNCIGRLARELMEMTNPAHTVYVEKMAAWFDFSRGREKGHPADQEVVGTRTMTLLAQTFNVFGLRGLDKLFGFMVVRRLQMFVMGYRQMMNRDTHQYLAAWEDNLMPLSTFPPFAKTIDRLYDDPIQRLGKSWWPHFQNTVLAIGHLQLLRRQISYELNFACKVDSTTLAAMLDTMNKAILMDVREHYRSPDVRPYPTKENPLLAQLSEYLEVAGRGSPFDKIYVTSIPLDHIATLTFLYVLTTLPEFAFDPRLDTLVNKAKKAPLDGVPFVVGVISLLKQFHVMHTQTFLALVGQYIRSNISDAASGDKASKRPVFSEEVRLALIFLDMFCKLSGLPRSEVENYVPSYIFDCIQR